MAVGYKCGPCWCWRGIVCDGVVVLIDIVAAAAP